MMITYNWVVTQCDRLTSDNFITTAHWTAFAVDGDYNASVYSTCSWQPETPQIPYADVTENEVLSWIWSSGVDKDATEASLAQQIELLKNPVTAAGVPWA